MKTTRHVGFRDEFLSVEDLDLRNLSMDEVMAVWDAWLRQAQVTNDVDRWSYSHGVFDSVPECARAAMDRAARRVGRRKDRREERGQ